MNIGLTLGGGGARGGVHMGVLEVLEPFGLRPQVITGTSIGGLIGAMVAKGMTLAEINDVVKHFNFSEMYSASFRSDVFSDNTRYRKFLEGVFGADGVFEELAIPLAVVATDLQNKQAVVLSSGEIVPATLATSALPLVFPVIHHQGYELLDGGLLNNTPFDVARARGADIVIAVDLTNTERDQNESMYLYSQGLFHLLDATPYSPIRVLGTMLDILNSQALKAHMLTSPPDVLIRPSVGRLSIMDFDRWDVGIEIGRQAAQAALPQLEAAITTFRQRERRNIFNKDAVLQTLNALVRFNRNAASLFAKISEQLSTEIAHTERFAAYAARHTAAAESLSEQVSGLGGKLPAPNNVGLEVQIQLMNFGKLVHLGDEDMVFRFCERTLAEGVSLYDDALKTRLRDEVRALLTRQHQDLEAELANIREAIS